MNPRFKFRVWNIKHGLYCDQMTEMVINSGGVCYDNGVSADYFEYNGFIIEQCTGLSDKNGNLIYENDVLLCERKIVDGATGTEISYKTSGVVQRDKNGMYFINGKDWYGSDITFYNECAEIIGNVHEQAEPKGLANIKI